MLCKDMITAHCGFCGAEWLALFETSEEAEAFVIMHEIATEMWQA